jgi:quinol monooxygenase YgiN
MSHSPEPVTVAITCQVRPEKLDEARSALDSVIRQVIASEPACRGIRVHEDPKRPHRWLIVERWDSEEAFTGPHMQQPHMQAFLKTAETFLDGQADFAFWRETLVA